jgi:hypothetical protein
VLRGGLVQPSASDDRPIQIAIDHQRRIAERDGIDLWRVGDLRRHTHPVKSPPRMRLEPAVLLLASRSCHIDDAIGVVADACRSHRTTPGRLRETRLPQFVGRFGLDPQGFACSGG